MKALLVYNRSEGCTTLLKVDTRWIERLRASGLCAFDALMHERGGQVMGWHRGRSETYRMTLSDGQAVFIKRAVATERMEILRDLAMFSRPQAMTHKEALAIRRVQRLGIAAPTIIAIGQRRRWRLPVEGFIVTLPLAGVALNELASTAGPERLDRIARDVAVAVARIIHAGYCWPDLLPRHVYVREDGRIGLLDLERLTPVRWGGRRRIRESIRQFLAELAEFKMPNEHIQTFVTALKAEGVDVEIIRPLGQL